MRARGGMFAALGGTAALVALLLLVARKGPLAALVLLLVMALAVFVISVIQVFVGRGK